MNIKLNGEKKIISENTTLEDLILELSKSNPYFVVAVNYNCIFAQNYASTILKEGDEVEILSPMQGG